jgi:acyl carrier protein
MTPDQVRAAALEALATVAPDADLSSVDPSQNLQEQFDLDSFDFYHFVVACYERTGVDVPERDYAQLATLDGCVSYLAGVAAT